MQAMFLATEPAAQNPSPPPHTPNHNIITVTQLSMTGMSPSVSQYLGQSLAHGRCSLST